MIKPKEKSIEEEATPLGGEPSESNHSDPKATNNRHATPHANRFRLPTAMRIRLKCGKKFKRQQCDIDKTPYSTIQEQPEEELKCSADDLDQSLANKNPPNNSLSDAGNHSFAGNFPPHDTVINNSHAQDLTFKVEPSNHDEGLPAPRGIRYEIQTSHPWNQNEDGDFGEKDFQLDHKGDSHETSGKGENHTYNRSDRDKRLPDDNISEFFRQLESGSSNTKVCGFWKRGKSKFFSCQIFHFCDV